MNKHVGTLHIEVDNMAVMSMGQRACNVVQVVRCRCWVHSIRVVLHSERGPAVSNASEGSGKQGSER